MGDIDSSGQGMNRLLEALRWGFRKVALVREAALIVFLVLVSLLLGVTTPNFASLQNAIVILTGLALDAVITVGMLVVMVSGGIDLSVGSVYACSAIIVAKMLNFGLPVLPAILIAIVVAFAWGAISGLLVTKVGISPLIATLGTMGMARGIVYIVTSGRVLANLPDSFNLIGQSAMLKVPNVIWLGLLVVILGDFLLRRSRLLRKYFYLGGNENAAKLSGLNIDRLKMGAYILCALLSGIAGVFAASRFGSAISPMGTGAELTEISACVIGGASLSGGEGTVLGSFLGLVLLALVRDGLILNDVSVYWQGFIQAAILVVAVSFDVLTRRRRRS
ncbi:MAG: ABC transporter permease [Spirochaetia bacterium]|jgi:ribose transport system permease protein